ncbi:LANO_0G16006g1_1 [Lachancea nothofagi CBS 11611]|uniref:LANO_0G16006g1_1 n=1 Tax=Lachancea nothofagi CBS 11611 TaxID=1266666 RepID=A0A1G4KK95_9SACH|nr:LANO_0G16006g1_1 [Lachancea nothofagi CBS 11611]
MVLFTTNGMFILDEIHTTQNSFQNVIGGGGMFAMLGACIVSPNQKISKQLKWIVDRGSDFPDFVTDQIDSWQTGVVYRDDKTRLTTRAWNLYGENDYRQFKYLSEKKRIDVNDWLEKFGLDELCGIPFFHLVCSDERANSILDKLKDYDTAECRVFVWEPIPELCDKAHAEEIRKVVNRQECVILSPNAEEGARLFGVEEPSSLQECKALLCKFDDFIADHNLCVLRCGKLGSLSLGERASGGKRQIIHLPAYHSQSPSKVIDPTGGGNTFLGGFSLGFVLSKGDLITASICGNIAAACSIEQLGVPQREGDKWNGLTFRQRLDSYLRVYDLPYTVHTILMALDIEV